MFAADLLSLALVKFYFKCFNKMLRRVDEGFLRTE